MSKWIAIAMGTYIMLYVLAFGATNAFIKAEFADFQFTQHSMRDCRSHEWFSAGWLLMPGAPIIAIFVTAGYQDGFIWYCKAEDWPGNPNP